MHRFAVATACATFVLLLVGGVVHATGSGMACPESSLVPLPLCSGQLVPVMQGKVLIEHGHRLYASTVGLMAVVLAVLAWQQRKADAMLAKAAIGAVPWFLFQGWLGRLTVVHNLPPIVSILHLASSMGLFSLVVFLAVRSAPRRSQSKISNGLNRLTAITALTVFLQLVLGATVRHYAAGLACLDFPFCGGAIWPTDGPLSERIHMTHRITAVGVGCLVLTQAFLLARRSELAVGLRLLAVGSAVLVLTQIGLGVLSVSALLDPLIVTAHLGNGALLLGSTWLLFLCTRATHASISPHAPVLMTGEA